MTEQIPGPRGLPLIGNILDLQDPEGVPLQAIERMIDIYGPIIKFRVGKKETIVVGGYDLFEELCNETRFWKVPPGVLTSSGGTTSSAQGLFAARSEKEMDWQQAHRILMPAFGPLAIENMFNEMDDIASQLMLKWARQGPQHRILAAEDFSRLTLDTIALCAMDYRFNSFYTNEMHPFVEAMKRDLEEKNQRQQVSGMFKSMRPGHKEALERDRKFILQIGAEIVEQRRKSPVDKKDLLNSMLNSKDPKTGLAMRDDLIIANMRTFLIAGHETTSGMLTFAFANMLKNPETYFAAQQEVDRVIGRDKIRPQHLGQLKYVDAMLKETLRLNPTAPAYVRGVRPENKEENPSIGCGKYAMPEHGGILCLLTRIHRDPKIWGNDAHEFKPERMLDWNFEKLPQAAWKPFGTGLRACIGRAFAWQEALLACALILQNFNMSLDDPNYQMKIVQTLAIKPKDFYMRAKLRPGVTAASLQSSLTLGKDNVTEDDTIVPEDKHEAGSNENLKILYGSNTGTCESLARKLASQAGQYGYRAGITDLDSAIEHVPTDMPVAIITASYEGQPCDNAARFTTWLQTLNNTNQLKGVKYAAFGVGHSDWRDTFQRQPKLIDAKFAELGAARLTECCGADVSKNNLFADFETWTEKSFWPSLPQPEGDIHRPQSPKRVISTLKLTVKSEDRAALLQQRLQWAKVLDTKQLTPPGRPQKRHIEIGLAEGVTYQVGDYLAILPINHEDSVKRVMRQFKLNIESIITIADAGPTTLPTNIPMHVDDLLKGYVELAQPATPRDIQSLAVKASSASEKAKLEDLNEQSIYEATILQHRISVLDLLEQYPSIELSLDQFLTMLPPLQPRHYSISSSPLQHPKSCTLTYSVIDAPTLSGLGDRFQGVSSTYLQNLKKGDDVLVSVRSTNKLFRLPTDPEHTPIMMFCAGSGIAPFRGFVEERAYLIQEGKRKLAPALLFVGFRSNDEDALYAEELVEWSKIGAVDIRYAFSQSPADSEGCKHVQDRMLHDREDVVEMFGKGAMVYICGSREVAQELGVAARELVNWKAEKESKVLDPALVEIFITTWRNSRFVSDVFT